MLAYCNSYNAWVTKIFVPLFKDTMKSRASLKYGYFKFFLGIYRFSKAPLENIDW